MLWSNRLVLIRLKNFPEFLSENFSFVGLIFIESDMHFLFVVVLLTFVRGSRSDHAVPLELQKVSRIVVKNYLLDLISSLNCSQELNYVEV